jgi:hypothetical protein
LNRLIDRAFERLFTRVRGAIVAVVAMLLYAGFGLAVPLSLHWSEASLIGFNILGTALAAFVTIGWLGWQIQARDRRHLVEWTTELRLLDAEEFEWLVGEVFRREGWAVRETGRQDAPDGNIDLELTNGDQRRIVQCKRWQSWRVGVEVVRAFGGTLLGERLPGSAGVIVTLSDFTAEARDEAGKEGILLMDKRGLYEMVKKVRRAEPCLNCRAPMLLDRSTHGWWFRCVAPGCFGKRDLGADPARAVDLLTQAP